MLKTSRSWYITANTRCPYSGAMVNEQEKYVQCPRSGWGGWEVRGPNGMVRDDTIQTQCFDGDDGGTTTTIISSTTTTSTETVSSTSSTTIVSEPSSTTTTSPSTTGSADTTTITPPVEQTGVGGDVYYDIVRLINFSYHFIWRKNLWWTLSYFSRNTAHKWLLLVSVT